jgi:hypothetical protein
VGKSSAKSAREQAAKKARKGVAGPVMGPGLSMPRGRERKGEKVEAALDELGITSRPLSLSLLLPYFKYVVSGILTLVDVQRMRAQKEYQSAVLLVHRERVQREVERVRGFIERERERERE